MRQKILVLWVLGRNMTWIIDYFLISFNTPNYICIPSMSRMLCAVPLWLKTRLPDWCLVHTTARRSIATPYPSPCSAIWRFPTTLVENPNKNMESFKATQHEEDPCKWALRIYTKSNRPGKKTINEKIKKVQYKYQS